MAVVALGQVAELVREQIGVRGIAQQRFGDDDVPPRRPGARVAREPQRRRPPWRDPRPLDDSCGGRPRQAPTSARATSCAKACR